jgi:hypothetical protein
MHSQYFDPIRNFPDRIDQLLGVINRVCSNIIYFHLESFILFLFSFTSIKKLNYQD